jgi:hypothetical protein
MNPKFNFYEDQKILILHGSKDIQDFYISRYDFCKKSIVVCNDYSGPISIKKTEPIWKANLELDKRGIQVRCLTDIRNENLEYCKEILQELEHLEIRHMDGVKDNLAIHDNRDFYNFC